MRTNIDLRLAALLLASSSVALTACGGHDHPDDTAEIQAALEGIAESEVTENEFLSTGITVRLADGRLFAANAGHVAPDHAVPDHAAAYDVTSTEQVIGSTSKLYTAVLVMQLVEEGAISLDDTVDRWVTFEGADAITVRMLLNHTSGLADYLEQLAPEQYGQAWTPEELLQIALDAGPIGEPGLEQGVYTNTNFLILGMIVEEASGSSWVSNLHARITEPLGLGHTYFAGEADRAEHLAGGWFRTDDGWLDSMAFLDPSIGWAVGGMVSTNEELMRFTEALFDGELFESPDTLAQMLAFETVMDPDYLGMNPPSAVGLCIWRMEVDGVRLDGHLGYILGYNSAALRDPDTGALIVVTSNDDRAFSGFTALKVAEYIRGL